MASSKTRTKRRALDPTVEQTLQKSAGDTQEAFWNGGSPEDIQTYTLARLRIEFDIEGVGGVEELSIERVAFLYAAIRAYERSITEENAPVPALIGEPAEYWEAQKMLNQWVRRLEEAKERILRVVNERDALTTEIAEAIARVLPTVHPMFEDAKERRRALEIFATAVDDETSYPRLVHASR